MIMKTFFKSAMCVCLSMATLGFVSCTEPTENEGIKSYNLDIELNFGDIDTSEITDFKVAVIDASGEETAVEFESYDEVVTVESLVAGAYAVSVSGQITETMFVVGMEKVELYADSSVEVNISTQTQSAIIFKTIHHASAGSYYISDCYFELVNNSDKVQYLDQIIVVAHTIAGMQTAANAWQAEGILDRYNAGGSYVIAFPGNGTDYPLEPGESVVVANNAITHVSEKDNGDGTTTVFNMPDLASAKFEVFNPDGAGGDIDNAADNMDIIFSNNLKMKSFGFGINGGAFILSRCPEGVTPAEYGSNPDNIMTVPNSEAETQYLMINSENVLDAVFIIPADQTESFPFFLPVDEAGYTTTPTAWSGNVVMRKSEVVDGVTKYIDTNNSTNDFDSEVANPYIKVTE